MQTKQGAGKKSDQLKRIFGNSLGSEPGTDQVAEDSLLLKLPQSVRVQIWVLLGFSHTKTLRLVCSKIKEDIDTAAGISSAIDSTFDDFPFHCNIAIRKVAIHELIIPDFVQFLRYPLVLRELEIRGEISLPNFIYIITSCPNIEKLTIVFNKFVLDQRTPMFPLSAEVYSRRPLSELRSVKIISSTKKFSELFYVYRTVASFLRDSLPDTKIRALNLWIAHKSSNVYLKEVLVDALLFIQKNAATLRYINLTIRDKDPNSTEESKVSENSQETTDQPTSPPASPPPPPNPPSQKTPASTPKAPTKEPPKPDISQRKETVLPGLPGVVITHHVKDLHTEDTSNVKPPLESAEGEANVEVSSSEDSNAKSETNAAIIDAATHLENEPWPKAVCLEFLQLSIPYSSMQMLLNVMSTSTKLHTLQLDAVGNTKKTWTLYQEFLKRGNLSELTSIHFSSVSNCDSTEHSLPINLKVFRKCKHLRKLVVLCQKKDDFSKFSRAKNISSLPKSLTEVSFERILLTPCQCFRLLFCYLELKTISLSYWSISDCQFSYFLALLKWVVKLDLTDANNINLVDTKIRFRNNRKAVRKLQQTLAISVKYQDFDETKLVIDASGTKEKDALLAPSISVIKITAPQPNPRRHKNPLKYKSTTTLASNTGSIILK